MTAVLLAVVILWAVAFIVAVMFRAARASVIALVASFTQAGLLYGIYGWPAFAAGCVVAAATVAAFLYIARTQAGRRS